MLFKNPSLLKAYCTVLVSSNFCLSAEQCSGYSFTCKKNAHKKKFCNILFFPSRFVVGTFVSWEWQAVACGALPLVFHLLMLLVPESPTYLIEQGRNPDASNALQWLRGASSSQQVESELQEVSKQNLRFRIIFF